MLINYSYEDRLRFLNFPTLKYRRLRGDIIRVHDIISEVHDSYLSIQFKMSNISNTRGNQYKMQLTHMHYNLQKHFFVIELFLYGTVSLMMLFCRI